MHADKDSRGTVSAGAVPAPEDPALKKEVETRWCIVEEEDILRPLRRIFSERCRKITSYI